MTSPRSNTRVLLVDDIEENLIALEALVRRQGVGVSCARSGREALELCLQHEFALALLDVNMPEMDGVQLAELMRGTQRTRDIPIIFVTAAYEPQRVFQGYDAGAVDFLFKPVDPRILHHKVATFVALYEQKRQVSGQLQQVEALSAQLTESLRLHETFVAALNHDLRTPLHTITMGLALLGTDLVSDKHKQVLRRITAATDRMNAMIDQLFDLARTRIGTGLELDPKPGDLRDIVGEVVHEAELRRGDKSLELTVTGDATGVWDLSRVARIAANLIGNALQHGAAGSLVKIDVDGAAADTVTFTVRNAGTIPNDLLQHIFEPFRRGNSSTQGLGLGLYIVREIAAAHGGTVAVESKDDVTRFRVALPRRTSAATIKLAIAPR